MNRGAPFPCDRAIWAPGVIPLAGDVAGMRRTRIATTTNLLCTSQRKPVLCPLRPGYFSSLGFPSNVSETSTIVDRPHGFIGEKNRNAFDFFEGKATRR